MWVGGWGEGCSSLWRPAQVQVHVHAAYPCRPARCCHCSPCRYTQGLRHALPPLLVPVVDVCAHLPIPPPPVQNLRNLPAVRGPLLVPLRDEEERAMQPGMGMQGLGASRDLGTSVGSIDLLSALRQHDPATLDRPVCNGMGTV